MSIRRRVVLLVVAAAVAWTAPVGAASSAGSTDQFFRMKQVKLTDPGMNQAPAIDLMIPTTWQFHGEVRWGGGVGGCFADIAAVFLHAQSPDGSVVFEMNLVAGMLGFPEFIAE